jgi:CubicO group peptidase (beta-lactamase class C family)
MSEALRQRNAKTFLDWMLGIVMARHPRMPALGGGLVVKDALVWSGVRGVRRSGHSSAVHINDRFQLGSITKPMTGYLLAVLRQQGKLDWDTTLGDTFPGLVEDAGELLSTLNKGDTSSWLQHWRGVTVTDLMTHTSGFDYAPSLSAGAEGEARLAAGSATVSSQLAAKRRIYTTLAMCDEPFHGWKSTLPRLPPPSKYSGGCINAAAMAEEVCNSRWEVLMVNHFFVPLGMTRYTFTNASSRTSVTDLWQHSMSNGQVVSAVIDQETHNSYTRAPAGAVSLSVPSWGEWAKALLKTTDDAPLDQAGLAEYFELPGPDYSCTRGGWFDEQPYFSHNGCNGWNYADMSVSRTLRVATLAATNIAYSDVADGIGDLRGELEGVGEAWPAMEHLSASLAQAELTCTASSSVGIDGPDHLVDTGFRTLWRSVSSQPELTLTLNEERLLRGLVLCQYKVPRIQSFELMLPAATAGGPAQIIQGPALDAMTQRDGLVIKVLFPQPLRVKTLVLKVRTATGSPVLRRLMVMTYQATRARSLAIGTNGRLWLTDHARRVLGTDESLDAARLVMDQDTLGVGPQVACAGGKLWAIGEDNKLWSSTGQGWQAVAGSPLLKRIAVDAQDDSIWAIDSTNAVREYRGGLWRQPPGAQKGLDVCGHAGKGWAVGLDGAVYTSVAGGWTKLPGASPSMKRIALDRSTLKLWGLDAAGGIRSRAQASTVWLDHEHFGMGKEIVVHAGTPYVIGSDDGVWRSVAQAPWQRLEVLQVRG